jgi:DNA-binding HxlR family transcriptional regulator
VDLRREAGSPPETTMRAYLKALAETEVVERFRSNEFPGNVEYQLTDGGREMLAVAGVASRWLEEREEGPTELGGGGAKSAITALVAGWSTSMVRALAIRPLTLTQLNSVISAVSYPSLERRLGAMRLAGLVERSSSAGRGRPYAITDWLRRGLAPLAAAAHWERRNLNGAAPAITNRDVESAFLLGLPLLQLPDYLSGSCRFGVQMAGNNGSAMAGAIAVVRGGTVESCSTRLDERVDASAVGHAGAWFAAVLEGDMGGLELSGDCAFMTSMIECLHDTLFGSVARK